MAVELIIPRQIEAAEMTLGDEFLAHHLTIGYGKPVPEDMHYSQTLPWVRVRVTSNHDAFTKSHQGKPLIEIPQQWFEIAYKFVESEMPFYNIWFNLKLLEKQAQNTVNPRSISLVAQAAGFYVRLLTHMELDRANHLRGAWGEEMLETLWGYSYVRHYPLLETNRALLA
ncbi:hypothetical protein HY408_01610 [Candidatus Gottesmanbacteria bacterium]|nr:hypothetical protein [Candidatus Gottesmanbacteria bacterium]